MKHVDVYVLDEFVGSYDIEGSGVEERRLLASPTRTVGDSGEILLVWVEEKGGGVESMMWAPTTPEEIAEASRFLEVATREPDPSRGPRSERTATVESGRVAEPSSTAINQLMSIIEPPADPVDAPAGPDSWEKVELQLGVTLPSDYKDFIRVYGSGLLGSFVIVYSAFRSESRYTLGGWAESICEHLRQDSFVVEEYGVHPQRPGLLPWGHDENGNRYYWHTKGEPDEWPVYAEANHYEPEGFPMSMTTFLAEGLMGRVRFSHWPDGWPARPDHLVFKPFRD